MAAAVAAAFLVCLASGSAAPSAQAGKSRSLSVFRGIGFHVRGTNGYSISVWGEPAYRDRPASVEISVSGRHGGADYRAPAAVTDDSVQADLGSLGRIDVSFHSNGERRTVRSKCGGKTFTVPIGSFEGTMEFHGEHGYTDVEAAAANGDMRPATGYACLTFGGVTRRGSSRRRPLGAQLEIDTGRETRLRMAKRRPSARAVVQAGVAEKREGVEIERFANLSAPPGSFRFDPALRTATVRLPAPFSGAAQFHRNAKRVNRWTGDLAVDLPGRDGVRLAGRGFHPSLVRSAE